MRTRRLKQLLIKTLLAIAALGGILTVAQAQNLNEPSKLLAPRTMKVFLTETVKAKTELSMQVDGAVAQPFIAQFGSKGAVIATATPLSPLSVKGCWKVALTVQMLGASATDSTGRQHPAKVQSQLNMCEDGTVPTQEQLTPAERAK